MRTRKTCNLTRRKKRTRRREPPPRLWPGLLHRASALWASALVVKYRDFRFVIPFVIQIGLYVSPVFYRLDAAPGALRLLMLANPFTWLILCFQDATFYGGLAHPWAWVLSGALALLFFMVGARAFNGLQRYFGTWL